MILDKFSKQPFEVKDYDIDYAEWLSGMSDTLTTVTATVACVTDPADVALVVNSIAVATYSAKFWVAGGTDGKKYKLTARATTAGGRIDESELIFSIKEV